MTLGLVTYDQDGDTLIGENEAIRSKWFLGGRKVSYRMSCSLDDGASIVLFRESVTERSWGLPPPTFTVEKTTIKGWLRSGEREDRSRGDGGTIDYARVREVLGQVANGAGWQFQFDGG